MNIKIFFYRLPKVVGRFSRSMFFRAVKQGCFFDFSQSMLEANKTQKYVILYKNGENLRRFIKKYLLAMVAIKNTFYYIEGKINIIEQ